MKEEATRRVRQHGVGIKARAATQSATHSERSGGRTDARFFSDFFVSFNLNFFWSIACRARTAPREMLRLIIFVLYLSAEVSASENMWQVHENSNRNIMRFLLGFGCFGDTRHLEARSVFFCTSRSTRNGSGTPAGPGTINYCSNIITT